MAYRNIVFAKIQLKVLREYRFTDQLTDDGKLMFFLLISLSGIMENEIPNQPEWICRTFGLKMTPERVKSAIENVAQVFPKLHINNGVISWENFSEIHNYIPGNSQGIAGEKLGSCKKKNKKEKKKESIEENGRFAPPTYQEVVSYCNERKNSVPPQTFIDFYASKGWMVGKNKMTDWKAAIRTWEKRDQYNKTDEPKRIYIN